jgi:MFS family permease
MAEAPAQGKALSPVGAVATVIGNAAEFYDFVSYSFFATYIGNAFFPMQSEYARLLASVATFGIGFLTRPLGGVVLGAYADRFGRRPAMTLTIVLMAIGSGLIAIIPPYAQIGVLAPIGVVLARLLQGFSVGGEVGPATSYLLEAAPPGRRGWYASWQSASQGIASLTAGLLGVGLARGLTEAQLQDWGWRVPFAAGLLILPIGLYIRRRLAETLDHEKVHRSTGALLGHMFRTQWGDIVLAILAIMGATVGTYVSSYMTTYALTTLHMSAGPAMMATVVLGLVGICSAAGGGALADRYNRAVVMIAPRVLLIVLVWPAFVLLSHERSVTTLLAIAALLAMLNNLSAGVMLVSIAECFTQSVRSTGFAVAYAVSVTIFGGTTQAAITWLIKLLNDPVAPAYYLIATNIPCVIGLFVLAHRMRRAAHLDRGD